MAFRTSMKARVGRIPYSEARAFMRRYAFCHPDRQLQHPHRCHPDRRLQPERRDLRFPESSDLLSDVWMPDSAITPELEWLLLLP
jgi:hypothetical protein